MKAERETKQLMLQLINLSDLDRHLAKARNFEKRVARLVVHPETFAHSSGIIGIGSSN